MTPADRVIVAIDERDPALARALVARLEGSVRWLKVGMTLYYTAGPAIVREFVDRGFRVFVDLKCHDIPHQVAGAVAAIADLGAALATVHGAGGEAMMRAAAEAAGDTRLVAVTALTSLGPDDLTATGVESDLAGVVARRAQLARACGLAGVVASPQEAASLRALLGPDAEIVTPGVRPAGSSTDDQRRVATPRDALSAGASRLVIGRPITRAADPAAAYRAIATSLDDPT